MRKTKLKQIKDFLIRKDAVRIVLFGSYVRGEAKKGSDIDLIVKFSKRKSLLEVVRIERELSETIGIKVDLLTRKAISPYLIDRIESQARVIYG
ncbi:MAG: nucleotidyltransferase family protein [Candidatus Omnitrophota bacterium]|nr:nucleotidyltransferase family protein [Candidatus Omnitrophota bacterium]